ncbi:SHOCT domain-containing protein [Candidatus Colwellia aromaticivorans]|uniref:SHOCT domain-containing protein n=1 Tax=Candidatus Colwellia aromaticivorans TaxID=2267621 RepID=UPI000DF2E834|nr:SHOCT domain-containing protein [Candidatus Colwellia aromaticivorans]
MSSKRYLCNLNHFITRAFVLVVSLFTMMQPFDAYSNEDGYQLTKVAQLEHQLISQPNWQQLIANPSNKQQHFIIRESGQVYLIDGDEVNPKAILDMSVFQQKDSSLFKLTAIELHPNFSLRDQAGYGTFYTAHIETVNKNSKTKRLQERADDLQLSFDTVITEWQFSAVNHQKVDVNTKREVLRIGVPDNLMVIKQMSFNPYIKSWNDDFGLLYVALTGNEKWQQPLYSGVILRINPAKFGLRSFRVPANNPYMKNSKVNDAIYLLGGQQIEQFIWPGKNSDHILVSHQYENKYLLSLTDGRNDWRSSAVKHILYQSDDAIHHVLMYQGRQLPLLRSKLLLLSQKEQHWFVDSLAFNLSDNKKSRDEKKPQLVWPITSQQLPTKSQIILSSNHDGEIFLLEKTINVLFRLTQQALANDNVVVDSDINSTIETNSSDNSLFILLLILVLLGTVYYWFKRKGNSVKAIVREQFASLELSESCQQIGLYHRHQSNAETIIDIVNIVSSEIKLNEQCVSVVNGEIDHGFNNEKEQDLRAIFGHEKTDKMVDGKVRQISLLLTDNRKNTYTVCLYMRKGSNRITKKPYVKVINELIDWCWLIGEKINADNTDKRKVKSIVLPKEKAGIKSDKKSTTPLHHQAADIRSETPKMDNTSEALVTDEISSTLKIVNENKHSAEQSGEESSEAHSKVYQNKVINTELVNALEKLVNLKQQGFLTTDEFSKAKEKLLKDLFEK